MFHVSGRDNVGGFDTTWQWNTTKCVVNYNQLLSTQLCSHMGIILASVPAVTLRAFNCAGEGNIENGEGA